MEVNIGDKFGRLTIKSFYRKPNPSRPNGVGVLYAECLCDCGKISRVFVGNLKRGCSKSCGCSITESTTKHGLSGTKLYKVHNSIRERCTNPNNSKYHNYGGRGITMHAEWLHNPKLFIDYCMEHGWRLGLTIDRINNNVGYVPGNLRFVSNLAQCSNMRKNINITIDGVTKCISSWARFYGLHRNTLDNRLSKSSPKDYPKCFFNHNISQS